MFIIIFILLPDIHEFLVWCLNVFVGFFSLFFLYLGLLAFASCLILNWFYIPCFGVSYEISVFPPLFSFLKLIWNQFQFTLLSEPTDWCVKWSSWGSFSVHYEYSVCGFPLPLMLWLLTVSVFPSPPEKFESGWFFLEAICKPLMRHLEFIQSQGVFAVETL